MIKKKSSWNITFTNKKGKGFSYTFITSATRDSAKKLFKKKHPTKILNSIMKRGHETSEAMWRSKMKRKR